MQEYFITFTILFFAASCSNTPSAAQPTYSDNTYAWVLHFDLSQDTRPHAEIHTKADTSAATPTNIFVELGFRSTAFQHKNGNLRTVWGSHGNTTTFAVLPAKPPGDTLSQFDAYFAHPTDVSDDVKSDQYGLHLVKDGLIRKFVYKHPPMPKDGPYRELDAVSIRIPDNAEYRELRDGKTEFPQRASSTGTTAYYDVTAIRSNNNTLEISYRVAPTPAQKLIQEYGLKFITLLASISTIILAIPSKDQRSPQLWSRSVFIILAVLFIAATALTWYIHSNSLDLWYKAVLDISTVTAGGFVAVVLSRKIKGDKWRSSTHNDDPVGSPAGH